MRLTLTLAALAAMTVTAAGADDPGAPKQGAPTAEAIINVCGGGLTQVFKFGVPKHVLAKRGDAVEEDDVLFRYDDFIVRVHETTVTNCFFMSDWKGPIQGIKIGDSREDVAKVLGKPRSVVKDKDGVETAYGYGLKGTDAKLDLWANFSEEGKVKRVEIELVK
jgi:hypothetical protein